MARENEVCDFMGALYDGPARRLAAMEEDDNEFFMNC
jgi:hypothetical protein